MMTPRGRMNQKQIGMSLNELMKKSTAMCMSVYAPIAPYPLEAGPLRIACRQMLHEAFEGIPIPATAKFIVHWMGHGLYAIDSDGVIVATAPESSLKRQDEEAPC